MSPATSRADLCQALLEGIALRTAEVIDAISKCVPIAPSLSVDGGLVRSRYFVQFLADCLGHNIIVPRFDELTGFGAASLAAHGLGLELPAPLGGAAACFEPRSIDRTTRVDLFADAVSRARKWRSPYQNSPLNP
jgi:glycerol kinase